MYKYLPADINKINESYVAAQGQLAISGWMDDLLVVENDLNNWTPDMRHNKIETSHLYKVDKQDLGVMLNFAEETPKNVFKKLLEQGKIHPEREHFLQEDSPLLQAIETQINDKDYSEVMSAAAFLIKPEHLHEIDGATFSQETLVKLPSFLAYAEPVDAPLMNDLKASTQPYQQSQLPQEARNKLENMVAFAAGSSPEDYDAFLGTPLSQPEGSATLYRGIRVPASALIEHGIEKVLSDPKIRSWSKSARTAHDFANTEREGYVSLVLEAQAQPHEIHLDTTPLYLAKDNETSSIKDTKNTWEWEVMANPKQAKVAHISGAPSVIKELQSHEHLRSLFTANKGSDAPSSSPSRSYSGFKRHAQK